MAMRFCILGSGSSGNSALLQTEGARVLVDAGFSAKKLVALLAVAGEALERIDAIFLTHEHGDHAAGIEGLKRFPHIRVFANAATARAVPHDAQEPVGFRFTSGSEGDLFAPRRSLAFLTDLGHAPQHIREHIRECEVIVIEANHCPELLKADVKRPWATKQRISGRHGHLSNDGARELLAAVASPRWRRVSPTHLSRDCNPPAAVERALADVRVTLRACEFAVVGAGEGTPFYN